MPTPLAWPAAESVSLPALAAVDATTLGGLSSVDRAAGSFVLVLLFGVGVLYRSQRFVEHSIDSSMARPHISLVYGLIGYGIVVSVGLYGITQLPTVGVVTSMIATALAVVVVGCILALAGLGYTVVGSGLLELTGDRQPWNGLVLGATISAITWLALPALAAAVVWVIVAAVGIGGPVREWIHDERTVETEQAA